MCRHTNQTYKIINTIFTSPYSAFSYNVYYIRYVLFLIFTTMCSYAGHNQLVHVLCVNEFNAIIDAVSTFHSGRIICALVMSVRLYQNTKHAK